MNIFFSYMNVAYTIYHTGGSLLRYWYVKASLRPEVAEVFMRKKTLALCLGIPQVLLGKPSIKKKLGPANKILHLLNLCLKSISGHSESFW